MEVQPREIRNYLTPDGKNIFDDQRKKDTSP
jgi:hypothetical protein